LIIVVVGKVFDVGRVTVDNDDLVLPCDVAVGSIVGLRIPLLVLEVVGTMLEELCPVGLLVGIPLEEV